MKEEDTVKKAQKTWHAAGRPNEDPRRNWDWRWGEVRRQLINRNKEEKKKRRQMEEKIQELKKHRIRVARSRTNLVDDELDEIEVQIKQLETEQEKDFRKWSKIRWIRFGEAPSKFFFSILKAKRAKEDIAYLKTADGRRISNHEDIIRELTKFYTELFKQDTVLEEDLALREDTLRLIKTKLNEEQNARLIWRPTKEETEELVNSLPSEKPLGLDGMTTEAERALGDPVEKDLLEMSLAFWDGKQITWKQQQGVIKLLPKDGDKRLEADMPSQPRIQDHSEAYGEQKGQGGFGLDAFRLTSQALRLKQVSKFFTNPEEEWVQAAELTIRTVKNKEREARLRDTWTIQEVLLLQPPKKVLGAPTTSGLVEAWSNVRGNLNMDRDTPVNKEISSQQYILLAENQGWIRREEAAECKKTLIRLQCTNLANWKHWATRQQPSCVLPSTTVGRALNLKDEAQKSITQLPWYWTVKNRKIHTWELTTKVWKLITHPQQTDSIILNQKWVRTDSTRTWSRRLTKIWKGPLQSCDKIWLWKIVQHGLPTQERAAKWGNFDKKCHRCQAATETIEHLFFDCRRS
ncbi:hypothetical protein R1sor_011809 [Riccia sorocarpa]|uniref:Reverse transcriptase zinc-binding domain-containing protein n=1 Tax=Riccia sorocarpa TaxID=122646 RepID=A0ABD3I2D0_9MARC